MNTTRSLLLAALLIAAAPYHLTSLQAQDTDTTNTAVLRHITADTLAPVDYSSLPALPPPHDQPRELDAHPGVVRIALLGNTLIQRAAEFGFLETELTARFPHKRIVFRNLGWPGDTVSGDARVEFGPGEENRSNWQRPDADPAGYGFLKLLSHLRREEPHILFVAYGSNVAFGQESELARFKDGLEKLLDTLTPTGVHIVLLSPPPRDADAPGLDPQVAANLAAQNHRLRDVAQHLHRTAQAGGHSFVDLFELWPASAAGYSDNGIHLNASGYRTLAAVTAKTLGLAGEPWLLEVNADRSAAGGTGNTATDIERTEYGLRWRVAETQLPSFAADRLLRIAGLQPGTYTLDVDGRRVARAGADAWKQAVSLVAGPDFEQRESLRQTIQRKNRQYFYGFRPQNKAYTHLFRRHERGQHAAEIERFALLVRETEAEIARLAVPGEHIYELVRETDYPDHEVPDQLSQPDVEQELAAFTVPDGFEISLFAADPLVSKPININWDEHGRMWVATSAIYPHLQPGQTPNDKIIVLEDVDKDGRADTSTVFADGLLVPQSVLPGNGGVYVAQSTDLLFLRDTDGDGAADDRQVLFTGFGNADVHHMIHGLRWGPGGDLYFTQSIYINSVVETPWGLRSSDGSCVWRLRPELLRLERYCQGLVNPWGLAFDRWGQSFATDGAGGSGIAFVFPGSAHATNSYAGRTLPSMNPGRPKECGLEVLSGRHLPEDWQRTLVSNDFRANRVTRYRLSEEGSGYAAEFLGDMVTSRHRGFRPVDIKLGPDGAIYIVDWYNLIIDHGEVDFHHPLRDKQHGRIWRLAAKGSPPVLAPKLAEMSTSEIVQTLSLPESWTRDQARRLLRERSPAAVQDELQAWLSQSGRSDADRLEALWVMQGLRQVDEELLREVLGGSEPRVRAAAVRVLADWHAELPAAVELLSAAVNDEDAQVRLEAVNALRSVGSSAAVEAAMRVVDKPLDENLEFAAFRTAHSLRDVWLPELQAGARLFDGQPHRIAFALSAVGTAATLPPLARLVEQGQLEGEQLVDSLAVLASAGSPQQSALVTKRLASLKPGDQARLLAALLQSNRNKRPPNAAALLDLFDSQVAEVRGKAIELSGRWQIGEAFPRLKQRALDQAAAFDERLAAAQAMVAVEPAQGSQTLRQMYSGSTQTDGRCIAVAALARSSVNTAAEHAAELLAELDDPARAEVLADALLNQQQGPQALAAALSKTKLPADTAATVLQRLRLSGREAPALAAAVRSAGNLPETKELTRSEIAAILDAVSTRGNAEAGRAIFQRDTLQCAACHAIHGQGGQVGPDLSSLGGSARLGDVLQSLIAPSATIKQGYQTAQLITADGRVITGVLQQRTDSVLRLRDAKNQLLTIATEDVDEVLPSPLSLMPTGLTEILTRQELVDLLSFLMAEKTAPER